MFFLFENLRFEQISSVLVGLFSVLDRFLERPVRTGCSEAQDWSRPVLVGPVRFPTQRKKSRTGCSLGPLQIRKKTGPDRTLKHYAHATPSPWGLFYWRERWVCHLVHGCGEVQSRNLWTMVRTSKEMVLSTANSTWVCVLKLNILDTYLHINDVLLLCAFLVCKETCQCQWYPQQGNHQVLNCQGKVELHGWSNVPKRIQLMYETIATPSKNWGVCPSTAIVQQECHIVEPEPMGTPPHYWQCTWTGILIVWK